MSEHIIGTSQAAIDGYEEQALAIFAQVNQRMQQLVTRAFALTYEGPDAETVFNPGLIRVATESVGQIDAAMTAFANAVSTVTSNISRSLGAGEIVFAYRAPSLELPPPPGVAADDYRIDIGGFESFINGELAEARQAVARFFAENQEAFNAIPRATADSPGWSGEARDYAQNTVVPAQTDNLTMMLNQVMQQITEFMTSAKDGTLSADRAGVGGA
jgi:hypothetical protein